MLPKNIAIVGAGETGVALAALVSLAGISVTLIDVREDLLQEAMKRVNATLENLYTLEGIPIEKRVGALDHITTAIHYNAAARADLVLEVLPENLQKKANAFLELDSVCSPSTIFCTNSAIFSLGSVSGSISNPSRFAGAHFPKPVNASRLVELSRGSRTSDKTLESLREFFCFLGKSPIVVNNVPGLVSERLFLVTLCEACHLVEEGIVSPTDLDLVIRFRQGGRQGVFELADAIGLDHCLESIQQLGCQPGQGALQPPKILVEKVRQGKLGLKTHAGFFEYR
ncbi:MAG: 3-hydroxyacyl-CoA dehydrogenase family protein [Candidatus Diapherotrites archaeon]|uniref:3-hydroxyacyl-CoA dehydrogenase family protein n=2 Tax=Candidatus Iainarchaeum sp. TaxID=3101447 RepID=A0A8T4LAS0_9ARCH|nr:3-hydroxyacyl-CoA dehydrogenase family protein [Candidatus Diapherotrites archaeon]